MACRIVSYILEHTPSFPGVEIRKNYLRDYPQGALAAHLLGNMGEITKEQLKERRFKGYAARRPGRPGRPRMEL